MGAELLAIAEGITVDKQVTGNCLVVESDCLEVVNILNGRKIDRIFRFHRPIYRGNQKGHDDYLLSAYTLKSKYSG